MSLSVVIINATNVPNVETFGKSDPYVSVEFQGKKKRRKIKVDKNTPTLEKLIESWGS